MEFYLYANVLSTSVLFERDDVAIFLYVKIRFGWSSASWRVVEVPLSIGYCLQEEDKRDGK
jgi:hypothetical protein